MKVIGVIPARWASTRFEGKVLADLKGKPLIQHVWERAKQCCQLDDLLIACDNQKVLDAAIGFGANAVMTDPDHASGTDRIAEAVAAMDVDVIVNIQGDEPLIDPAVIDGLVKALEDDLECPMATVVKEINNDEDRNNPNVVKAVVDKKGYALYFSRANIPHNRDKTKNPDAKCYKHLGLYAYRKDFLLGYKDLPKSKLEDIEKLEQLRALEAGYKIKTIKTDHETIGVDTPEDLKRAEQLL